MNSTDKILTKYSPSKRYLILDAIADVDQGRENSLKRAILSRGLFMEENDIISIMWEMKHGQF